MLLSSPFHIHCTYRPYMFNTKVSYTCLYLGFIFHYLFHRLCESCFLQHSVYSYFLIQLIVIILHPINCYYFTSNYPPIHLLYCLASYHICTSNSCNVFINIVEHLSLNPCLFFKIVYVRLIHNLLSVIM